MKIKDFLANFKDNLLNMKIKSKSFILMILATIILSMIFTPIIGIPVGLAIGVYVSENN
ncbi:VraH family protein [Staphylococcus hominis]|uniref:VraH family peptide resistance protein n=1 Tax=Staphylococcus hominis TaxID=1290 RepID=UPI00119D2361|nr:VraH family protein [Staphylococcus hominis]